MANIYNTSEGTVYGSYFDDAIVNDYPALVYRFAGNDQITNMGSFIYADADEGNDILINYASNAHVYLFGGGGNDVIYNYNSNDVIFCYYSDYSPPVPYVQGNDLIFDAAQGDTIHLCDTALSDIVATSVNENSIAIAFNTGEVAMVGTTENISPTFKLASGESYVYDRESSAWQQTKIFAGKKHAA